jgi:hypothetical protein
MQLHAPHSLGPLRHFPSHCLAEECSTVDEAMDDHVALKLNANVASVTSTLPEFPGRQPVARHRQRTASRVGHPKLSCDTQDDPLAVTSVFVQRLSRSRS